MKGEGSRIRSSVGRNEQVQAGEGEGSMKQEKCRKKRVGIGGVEVERS